MKHQENLRTLIGKINQGKSYPALSLVKNNPEMAAVISKLVKPRDKSEFDINRQDSHYNLNQSQIQAISESIKSRITDNENIIQLFPDIELAIQIIVSSVLSPKDMVKTEIIYRTKDPILPSELTMKLNGVVQSHLESYYNFKDDLQTILRETLFDTGSYVDLVIPENILDEIINNNQRITTESLSPVYSFNHQGTPTVVNLGILGPAGAVERKPTFESFLNNEIDLNFSTSLQTDTDGLTKALEGKLEVSDNFHLLKLPKITEAANKEKIRSKIRSHTALESAKLSNTEFSSILYKDKSSSKSEQFMVLPSRLNSKRKSIGRPLRMRLPSESVIPVYIPGDETRHIGYFILIDIDGNPVTINSNLEHMVGLNSMVSNANNQQSQSLSSLLIQKARNNLIAKDGTPTIDQITKVYTSIVEKDLVERLKNGMYKQDLKISTNNEIYRIMLARILADQYTRLVYIPADLITYYAFKYHNNGVGRSYLDDLKVLSSLRAIILFSKVMAMTKNSIALTHVNMTLDPNDPDPKKSIEIATHDIVKMRQQYFPLGINSPVDLVDWIQRAGFEFTFEGHPRLPQTKFEFETKNLQHALPDTELDELLRKQTFMAFGLSPEVVDNGFTSEFATTIISNNILHSKRVLQLQSKLIKFMSSSARKIILNDSNIIDELLDALKENKGLIEKSLTDEEREFYAKDPDSFFAHLTEAYVENLELDLPKPDITSIENQTAAYDQYVESLDKALDAWINSDYMTDAIAGDVSGNIDSIKAVFKSYFLRAWMSENGFMSELNDIVTADEDGKPTLDLYDINHNHIEGLIKSTVRFIESLQAAKTAANADLSKMDVEGDEPAEGGADEFDMGDEFGTGEGEEPIEEEPTGNEEEGGAGNEEGEGGESTTEAEEKPI